MSNKKIVITIDGPIMSGSVSVAESKCGKLNCACKARLPQLHGPFHRWTGVLNGKRTTKTISKEVARECARRIENYHRLQKKLNLLLEKEFKNAPWNND